MPLRSPSFCRRECREINILQSVLQGGAGAHPHQRAAGALWILQCELLPEPGIKISSEGKALFFCYRAEVQSCQEGTSSSHSPYKSTSWSRGLRLGGVIPNFTHCADTAASDTLIPILRLVSLCPDLYGGERGIVLLSLASPVWQNAFLENLWSRAVSFCFI